MWVHEKPESEDPERPVCRSKEVHKKILEYEANLKVAMEKDEFYALDEQLNKVREVDIDVRLR